MYCKIYNNDSPYVEVFIPVSYKRNTSDIDFDIDDVSDLPYQIEFDGEIVEDRIQERLHSNLCRIVRNVYDLSCMNHFDYFMTVTLDGKKHNRMDIESVYKKLSKCFNNYRNRYAPDFRYLCVPELHSDKVNWHFHILVAGVNYSDLTHFSKYKHIPKKIREKLLLGEDVYNWEYFQNAFGFNSLICTYGKQETIAKYMTKYITKNVFTTHALKGMQLLRCSQGLNRPVKKSVSLSLPCDVVPSYENDWCVLYHLSYEKYLEYGGY